MGIGVGINALNWLGLDMYYSSNLGFGGNMQLTPFSTFGGEISYKEGISLSIGVINGDTTHEINFNIGWGTIISAAAIAVAVIIYLIYILYWWFCVKNIESKSMMKKFTSKPICKEWKFK